MDLLKIVKSVELLIYEVMTWVIHGCLRSARRQEFSNCEIQTAICITALRRFDPWPSRREWPLFAANATWRTRPESTFSERCRIATVDVVVEGRLW
jgi:hypothetical protein